MENIKTVNDLRGTVWKIADNADIEIYPGDAYVLSTSDLTNKQSYIKLIRENWQGERYELDIAPYIQESPSRLEDNLINLNYYDHHVATADTPYHIGVIQDSTLYFSPNLPENYLVDAGAFLQWLKEYGTLIDIVKPTLSDLFKDITNALREKQGTTEPIKHLDIASKIRNLGGGVEINGNVETYECLEPITAGDFVEFLNNVNKELNSNSRACFEVPSAILLESNKVFIAHSYSSSNYLYGTIVEINGTEMTATTTQLNSDSKSCYEAPSCCLLDTNKVFIAHCYGSNTRYLYGTIVEINGTEMTATTTQLNGTSYSCYYAPSAILLESNKVFIAHSYSSNYYRLYGTIVEINGTTMTPTTTQLNGTSYSCSNAPSCCLLDTNKVFIAHCYSSYYLYGTIVEINGTTMTPTTTQLNGDSKSCRDTPSAILLESNKVFIAHKYSDNFYLYGTIVEINGTTMTPTTTQLNNKRNICYFAPSAILLESNKVFIAHSYDTYYYLYGTIYIGNKVLQLTNTINGVAKTGGNVGEEIQVYIPKEAN